MTNKLKELRKAKGLTQQQLAELANIDTSYVSRLETGKRGKGKGGKGGLTFVKIKALADALGVLPEDLVDPETLAQVSSEAATRATSPNASFPPIHHNLGSDDWIPVR
ncbi:helix-turn-helix transcriptional regulator, partial [Salmonella enterica subsp. enterica serovar Paratyphi A]